MDISSFHTDHRASEEGAWVDNIPGAGDLRLKVRGHKSMYVAKARGEKERKISRDQREDDGSLKPDVALAIYVEVMHEAILLDWDGLTDNGEPVPYDKKLAKEWLSNPKFRHFADAVTYASSVVDNRKVAEKEFVAKNSKGSSSSN